MHERFARLNRGSGNGTWVTGMQNLAQDFIVHAACVGGMERDDSLLWGATEEAVDLAAPVQVNSFSFHTLQQF